MDLDPEHAKLDAMAARIRQAEGKPAGPAPEANAAPMKMSRIGFDFLGAVLGGTLIGWLVDKYMPQLAPWGLIVMILLGFGAGIMNVWRALAGPNQDR
jgi:ATP synthase protein I